RRLERSRRRYAGVENVETARAKAGEAGDRLDGQRSRGVERQRCRSRVLEERGIEMVGERRRDDDVRGVEDACREIVADDRIVAEFQMQSVFLRSGAQR